MCGQLEKMEGFILSWIEGGCFEGWEVDCIYVLDQCEMRD